MTLQDWGAFGELVGGVAVIATLIYLAVQTRQTRRAAMAQAPQWISDGYRNWFATPRQDPDFAKIVLRFVRTWSELDPIDQLRVHLYGAEMIVHLDAVLTLREQGLSDDDSVDAWVDNSLGLILTPGGLEWWSDVKFVFTPRVRGEIERRLQDPSSLPAPWTEALPFFRLGELEGARDSGRI